IFALVLSAIYWYVSYEWAGTVLLFLFGLGSAGATLILGRIAAAESRAAKAEAEAAGVRPDGPFGDESARVPRPTFAPVVFGVGLALAALGLAFGPWLFLAAAMPIALGAISWLSAANAEWRAAESEDQEAAAAGSSGGDALAPAHPDGAARAVASGGAAASSGSARAVGSVDRPDPLRDR
ncbi:MAG TPA: cytochrome c oxidase subunit 4, partial [Candidatus Limnocylindrales bacterium]|nr:cytochrome c oxidase subunit 4 [Candidatus Limnocylindrales bacterium]